MLAVRERPGVHGAVPREERLSASSVDEEPHDLPRFVVELDHAATARRYHTLHPRQTRFAGYGRFAPLTRGPPGVVTKRRSAGVKSTPAAPDGASATRHEHRTPRDRPA